MDDYSRKPIRPEELAEALVHAHSAHAVDNGSGRTRGGATSPASPRSMHDRWPRPRRRRHRVQPPAAGPAAARRSATSAVEADDGRQALRRLRDPEQPPIDVILLDIVMPEMDGYQTLEALRPRTRPCGTCR